MIQQKDTFKSRSGQAMIEMALVIIPLMMLLFGTLDAGWALFRKISLGAATREGLRIAAINSFPVGMDLEAARDAIKDRIIQSGTGLGLKRENIVINVNASGGALTANKPQVIITTTLHHRYIGAMQFIGKNSVDLVSTYQSAIATWVGNETPRYVSG